MTVVHDLAKAVKKIAKENPDAVTEYCKYFNDDGTPCCVVGQGLSRIGYDQAWLMAKADDNEHHYHEYNKYTSIEAGFLEQVGLASEDDDPLDVKFLSRMQWHQDQAKTFAEAKTFAKEDVKILKEANKS